MSEKICTLCLAQVLEFFSTRENILSNLRLQVRPVPYPGKIGLVPDSVVAVEAAKQRLPD